MILLSTFSFSPHTLADLEPEPPSIPNLIAMYSKEYKVSAKTMTAVINCENKPLDPELQSELKYKKGNRWKQPAGSREQSFGLVQIHLPDHPEITKAEATDPDFSIEFLADQLSRGRGSQWTCYRKLRG